jgi:hypothetical protein
MADLNALIAQGAQFRVPPPVDPMGNMPQLMQMRASQNQNALAQYQLSSAKREDASTNALNAAYQNAYDPATGKIDPVRLRQSLASGGAGSRIPGVEKGLMELENERLQQQKLQGDVNLQPITKSAAEVKLLDDRLKQSRGFLDTLDATAPDAGARYLAWHEANHADPIIGPALTARGANANQSRAAIEQAIAKGPQALADLINQSKLGAEKFMEMNKPTVTSQNLGGQLRMVSTPGLGGAATVVPGSTVATTMTPGQIAANKISEQQLKVSQGQLTLAQTGQNLTDAREQRKIAIMEENQRRENDPAFQRQKAEAAATGQAIAKDKALAQQLLPKVLETAQQTLGQIDSLIGKRDREGNLVKGQAPHPGFSNVVGATLLPGLRFVPGTDAADFQSKFDQIKGGAFLQAFETLKGGGSITNLEGEKGTSALNRMSLAQSEKEFVSAAREFQSIIRKGVERAKVRVGGSVTPIDALLEKYK